MRRLLHGGVDRNFAVRECSAAQEVASFTGAWIETPSCRGLSDFPNVASFTGAWIETCRQFD